MVASSSSGSPNFDPIDHDGIAPGTDIPCLPSACYRSAADGPKASSHKESRRSVPKRVVTVPIAADGLRPKADGAPPSDSWAWRKYGQKPIKGSPYPRGYYKCSGSKGCPARKQVERSRVDPTVLVVTYAYDHNHPGNLHHQVHHHISSPSTTNSSPSPSPSPSLEPLAHNHFSQPDLADPEDKFSGLVVEAGPVLMMDEGYCWFSDVGSPGSTTTPPGATDDLLLGDIVGSANADMKFLVECDEVGGGGDEDSLFAGLGELP